MIQKTIAAIIQKLTTTKFVSSFVITLLEYLSSRTENKLDDKLVKQIRVALEEKPEGKSS
jgi:hypothetical protein